LVGEQADPTTRFLVWPWLSGLNRQILAQPGPTSLMQASMDNGSFKALVTDSFTGSAKQVNYLQWANVKCPRKVKVYYGFL